MLPLDRRSFLASSLGGLAATLSSNPLLVAADSDRESKKSGRSDGDALGLDSLFLTWRQDPTTTMTIQWVGPDVGSAAAIRYALLAKEDWQSAPARNKPFPDTDLKVRRCELTGLTPGTEYQFQIEGQKRVYRFRTMPSKATDTIQFVSGGDAGVGAHAIGSNILAAKQEPYFALIGGDLAYDNGKSPETFVKFLRNYHEHMVDPQGRLVPLISCMGNHEVRKGYNGMRTDAPHYLSVFDGLFAEKTYGVLDIGDYLSIVLLDTGHIAPIGGEQTDWLARCLSDRQERPHLIVANHVPAYPSHRSFSGVKESSGTGGANRRYWSPLFETFNVDVVLEHHDHTFKRTHPLKDGLIDKHGVIYLGDGSWGKLRTAKKPESRPYLATMSEAYHITVHRLEGERRFHVALEESGKVADVCATTGKRAAK